MEQEYQIEVAGNTYLLQEAGQRSFQRAYDTEEEITTEEIDYIQGELEKFLDGKTADLKFNLKGNIIKSVKISEKGIRKRQPRSPNTPAGVIDEIVFPHGSMYRTIDNVIR
jgi:hypothetical protein